MHEETAHRLTSLCSIMFLDSSVYGNLRTQVDHRKRSKMERFYDLKHAIELNEAVLSFAESHFENANQAPLHLVLATMHGARREEKIQSLGQ